MGITYARTGVLHQRNREFPFNLSSLGRLKKA